MAATSSTMVELGTILPAFTLHDVTTGQPAMIGKGAQGATVVAFICNHCPYVVHIAEAFVQVAKAYQERGISFVAICSNDADAYPADAPDRMVEFARHYGFTFPYCHDSDQSAAKAYDAVCTPDIFVHDADGRLVYRGRFDESRPGSGLAVTGKDLRSALDALLSGTSPGTEQFPSIGCSIKWKQHP
ncbi:MAG TPA: thioredoxin family protein [Bacteroidetes bacterium]|nr:thioredoxin family protein [Bacteroidota bacterium]HRK03822.1 thioredoxin family protein [Chlorobiota bacterium]